MRRGRVFEEKRLSRANALETVSFEWIFNI